MVVAVEALGAELMIACLGRLQVLPRCGEHGRGVQGSQAHLQPRRVGEHGPDLCQVQAVGRGGGGCGALGCSVLRQGSGVWAATEVLV